MKTQLKATTIQLAKIEKCYSYLNISFKLRWIFTDFPQVEEVKLVVEVAALALAALTPLESTAVEFATELTEPTGISSSCISIHMNKTLISIRHWWITSIWLWSVGTGMNWGKLLLNHMVMSRFMLMANGSNPSCRPQMAKYCRLLTFWPRLIRPTWDRPRAHTGIKPEGENQVVTTRTREITFPVNVLVWMLLDENLS